MKKRIFALFLAMVMVFGMSTTTLAAGSGTEDNTEEVNEIKVSWSETTPWNVEIKNDFEIVEGDWVGLHMYLYKDGTLVKYYYDNIYYGDGDYINELIKDDVQETGEYQVKVTTSKRVNGQLIKYAGETEAVKYVNPGKKLTTPANVSIDSNKIVKFDAVEGVSKYEIWYSWYEAATGYEIETDWYIPCDASNCTVNGNTYAFDLTDYIYDYTNAYDVDYKIKVRAVSSDINVIRHSDFSEEVVYEIRVAADKIEEKLDDAIASGNIERARDILATGTSNDTLVEMLKTDAEFAKKVADLDKKWAEEQNITVTPKSEVAGIDSSKVSIIGAALNAGKDANVELTIKEPTTKVNVAAGYFNAVQLDINLLIDNETMKELEIPVSITMPIPAGVSADNLVILHYHEDGKDPVVITPTVSTDKTMMTFVVDGFSTFVVANTEADGTGDTDPIGTLVAIMALSAVVAVVAMKKKTVAR